jgi:hypothetical protein
VPRDLGTVEFLMSNAGHPATVERHYCKQLAVGQKRESLRIFSVDRPNPDKPEPNRDILAF